MRKLEIGQATYLWRVSRPHHRSGIEDLFTAYLDGHPRSPQALIELARERGWKPESHSQAFEITDGWAFASKLTTLTSP